MINKIQKITETKQQPTLVKINERPTSALLSKFKDNPTNSGLNIMTQYVPYKSKGPTSLCVV